MAANSTCLIKAKKQFKKILEFEYSKINKHYFSIWTRFLESEKTKKLNKRKMIIEEEI